MKILLVAFAGKMNSSRVLIDAVDADNKLILTNSFVTSEKQLIGELERLRPDLILAFGQRPGAECLHIELRACQGSTMETGFDVGQLSGSLNKSKIPYIYSDDAGDYLCNHVYFVGLKYIAERRLDTKMIFVHVPSIRDFADFDRVREWLGKYVEEFES